MSFIRVWGVVFGLWIFSFGLCAKSDKQVLKHPEARIVGQSFYSRSLSESKLESWRSRFAVWLKQYKNKQQAKKEYQAYFGNWFGGLK